MSDYYGSMVSAIISTHNRPELLPRAIESVLNQTYPHLELIVVDDSSGDSTERVVRRYQQGQGRLRYLRTEKPSGACVARSLGIGAARGEFVAGLDDDDEWLPRRVERLLGAYGDEYAYVCSRDRILYRDRIEFRKFRPHITLDAMLYRNVTGNQVLTKRKRILAVGGFDRELSSGQDYDLWLRLLERYGDAIMVDEPLQNIYRDHLECRISTSRKKVQGELRLYRKHKAKMSQEQRRLHLIEIKRLKNRKLTLFDVMATMNTECFPMYLRFYLKKKLGRV